jgi:SAM-dependent methyltransferase
MKDLFSSQSKAYAAFRPTYPEELYDFVFQHVRNKADAWDCATGNGQVAHYLARHFDKVHATDISQQQLDHAFRKGNIFYSVSPAEETSFQNNQFDLITVAQALHWFDRELFYTEVRRVCKPGGILAAWGYGFLYVSPNIDKLMMRFYKETVGPYWDQARRLVEDEYRSISFPFEQIKPPVFSIKVPWTLNQLSGYLSSWSATQKFINEKGYDPVQPFTKSLVKHWTQPVMAVTFPIFTKIGIVNN